MKLASETFFIGVIDFFSIMLPGAVLTSFAQNRWEGILLGTVFPVYKSEPAGWAVFLFSSYVLGHFVFLLGAKLDDWLYGPIRNGADSKLTNHSIKARSLLRTLKNSNSSVVEHLRKGLSEKINEWVKQSPQKDVDPERSLKTLIKELNLIIARKPLNEETSIKDLNSSRRTNRLINRKTQENEVGWLDRFLDREPKKIDVVWLNRLILRDALPREFKRPNSMTRWLAQVIFRKDAHIAVEQAEKIKEACIKETDGNRVINTFQWTKARLAIQCPTALGEVQRLEADSKFFRSLLVVLLVLSAFFVRDGVFSKWSHDYAALAVNVRNQQDPVSSYLWGRMPASTQRALTNQSVEMVQAKRVLDIFLNNIVKGPSIYETNRFAAIPLSSNTVSLLSEDPHGANLRRLNYLLLAAAYPSEIRKNPSWLLVVACLFFIWGSGWRYMERRFKATQQAYWYVITLEHLPTVKTEQE